MDEEDDNSEENPTLCSRIPQRYIIVAVLCLVMGYNVSARTLYDIQIEYLVVDNESEPSKSIVCVNLEKNRTNELKFDQYNWSDESSHELLEFYFIFYIFLQPVVGYFSDRFIKLPRFLLAVGVLSTTIFCFLSHTIISASKNNVLILKIARLVLGMGQSVQFPASTTVLSHWVPSKQRAFLCGLVSGAIFFVVAIRNPLARIMINRSGHWYLPSYIAGGVGVLILYAWYRYGYGDPYLSPHITKTERRYLDAVMGDSIIRENKRVPVTDLLTDLNVWLLIMCSWGVSYYWYSIDFSIKLYYKKAYLLNNTQMTLWNILPYLSSSASTCIFGFLSDWLVNRSYVDVVTLRKIFTNIGIMGPPIYAVAATYVGCNKPLTQAFVSISMALQGTVFVGIRLLPIDLAPNYSGFIVACLECTDTIVFFTPTIHKAIVTEEKVEAFRRLFGLCLGVSIFSNLWIIPLGHVKMTSLGTDVGKFYKNN